MLEKLHEAEFGNNNDDQNKAEFQYRSDKIKQE